MKIFWIRFRIRPKRSDLTGSAILPVSFSSKFCLACVNTTIYALQVIRILLQHPDLDINFTGSRNLSPLMVACIEGNAQVNYALFYQFFLMTFFYRYRYRTLGTYVGYGTVRKLYRPYFSQWLCWRRFKFICCKILQRSLKNELILLTPCFGSGSPCPKFWSKQIRLKVKSWMQIRTKPS